MPEKTVAMEPQNAPGPEKEGTRAQEQFAPPPVDIYETPDALVVEADLPGVGRDDLRVEVKDGILTIEGHARAEAPGRSVYREFEMPSYRREFQLSDAVDVERISAQLRNGVLTLRLPRPEQARPKQIRVEA
ncbi:MAG: Hsp20/alpha crystallin family protein [Chthonomonadales bacterium]|nr:Hsp20/alpha crystallin family protein [Chthonomonadales bacterium]